MQYGKTKEPQYQELLSIKDQQGVADLGLMTNQVWHDDPKRLAFVLSRYKFVSKMLAGKDKVLEVGCGDAFATRIVLKEVSSLTAIDFDPIFIEDAHKRMKCCASMKCFVHDILESRLNDKFDAAYSLDVFEHIDPKFERTYLKNITDSLTHDGVFIIGMPSLQSQKYASEQSKQGHVNCKDEKDLRNLLKDFYENIFIFSMNDEVVHTGFYMMAHYYFALCVSPKEGERE